MQIHFEEVIGGSTIKKRKGDVTELVQSMVDKLDELGDQNDYTLFCKEDVLEELKTILKAAIYDMTTEKRLSTEGNIMENMMDVVCIEKRESNINQIIEGDYYYIDRNSIWIDSDGDAYGEVYNDRGEDIGQLKLSHFCTLQ